MSNQFELNAVARDVELQGKGASRRLRKQNLVPAIIYGGNEEPKSVSLKHNELVKLLENEAFFASVFNIAVEGSEDEQVVIKALQRHPAKGFPMHADFQRIVKGHTISMSVPIHFEGKELSPGLKSGGILDTLVNELDIHCLPSLLPEYISVDVSTLDVGGSVHLSDIKLSEGVTLSDLETGNDRAVVNIQAAKTEAVADTAPVAPSNEPADIAK